MLAQAQHRIDSLESVINTQTSLIEITTSAVKEKERENAALKSEIKELQDAKDALQRAQTEQQRELDRLKAEIQKLQEILKAASKKAEESQADSPSDFIPLQDPTTSPVYNSCGANDFDGYIPEDLEIIASNKFLGVKDRFGKTVIPLTRRYSDLAFGYILNDNPDKNKVFVIFTRDGKQGVSFLDGAECISNIYDSIAISDIDVTDGCFLWAAAPWGVEIFKLRADKNEPVKSMGQTECTDYRFTGVGYDDNGFPFCAIKRSGRWSVINRNGELVLKDAYDEAPWVSYNDDDRFYFVIKKGNKYGIIDYGKADRKSKIVLPFEYDLIFEEPVSDCKSFIMLFKGTYDRDSSGAAILTEGEWVLQGANGLWGCMVDNKIVCQCVCSSQSEAEDCGYKYYEYLDSGGD